MSQDEYERVTAIVTHTTISISIQRAFPELSIEDRDAMYLSVIDRLAHMRGFAIKCERTFHEDEDQ